MPSFTRVRAWLGGAVEAKAAPSLATPDASLIELFGGSPVASGIVVTPRTAMQCAPVRCAVQTIAEAVAMLPLAIYSRNADGSADKVSEHPVARLVNDEPNEWTSGAELVEALTRDSCLWGNGYAIIVRVEGRPVELIRLRPETVAVEYNVFTLEPTYRIGLDPKTNRSGQLTPRQNVLHLKAPSLDGVVGNSPVLLAKEAIGLAMVLEQHGARLFGNGARPSGLITFPNALNPEAATKAKAAWQAAHGGSRSGGTAVLDNGASWSSLALNSVDAQFLELRKFSIEEIARVFRVPPHMLMEMGRATWSNSEEMGRQFVQYTLMRWLNAWEGEIRLKLLSRVERETLFPEFQVDDLLRGSLAERAKAYTQLIAARVFNPNEARARENLSPYDGGDTYENFNVTPNGGIGREAPADGGSPQ